MGAIVRLVSFVDSGKATVGKTVDVSVRHEAELENGKQVLLLSGRGWSSNEHWSDARRADIEETARIVVGPDEPYGEESAEGAATGHWNFIQEILVRQGIKIAVSELRTMRHDVLVSKRLQDRLGKSVVPSDCASTTQVDIRPSRITRAGLSMIDSAHVTPVAVRYRVSGMLD